MVMSFFGRQNRKQGSYRFLRGIALNGRPFPKHQPARARADEKDRGKRFEVTGSSGWRSLQGFRVAEEIEIATNRGAKIARLLKLQIHGSLVTRAQRGGSRFVAINNFKFGNRRCIRRRCGKCFSDLHRGARGRRACSKIEYGDTSRSRCLRERSAC